MQLTPAMIDEALAVIHNADIVMVQQEIPISVIEHVSKICHDLGVKLLLNPAIREIPSKIISEATYITRMNMRQLLFSEFISRSGFSQKSA